MRVGSLYGDSSFPSTRKSQGEVLGILSGVGDRDTVVELKLITLGNKESIEPMAWALPKIDSDQVLG